MTRKQRTVIYDRLCEVTRASTNHFPHRRREAAHAMKRLEEGAYGVCIDCERDIPKERLLAKPEALRCLTCQARHEGGRAQAG